MHRVASEDSLELGTETTRYFDLAHRDWISEPHPAPEWLADAGATFGHVPTLPRDPASAYDELGHAIFRRVLEDIARTTFTGDEADRVHVLALIDRVAVATRAELGRLLLSRLANCAAVEPGEHRVEHRTMYIDDGDLHLSFTTMTQLTGYVREIHKSWVLHRRQTFLRRSDARGPVWPWSVAVLLTPCVDQRRPWDTTVLATNGPPHFDEEEYVRLEPILAVTEPDWPEP